MQRGFSLQSRKTTARALANSFARLYRKETEERSRAARRSRMQSSYASVGNAKRKPVSLGVLPENATGMLRSHVESRARVRARETRRRERESRQGAIHLQRLYILHVCVYVCRHGQAFAAAAATAPRGIPIRPKSSSRPPPLRACVCVHDEPKANAASARRR